MLNHGAILGLAVSQLLPFPDIVGNRLLGVSMLAIGSSSESNDGVSVVGRGNANGIDIGILANLTVVLVSLQARQLVTFLHFSHPAFELIRINVAQTNKACFCV